MKKFILGFIIAGICGIGVTTMASENKAKTRELTDKQVNAYIESIYGLNWANDLYSKHGEKLDDVLELEAEKFFGKDCDDIIDKLIRERLGNIDLDDKYDDHDDKDDLDDKYDDHDDNDDLDDKYDDHDDNDDKNDLDDRYDD